MPGDLRGLGKHQFRPCLRCTEKTKKICKGKPTWPKGSRTVGEEVCHLGSNGGFTGKTYKNKVSLKCCVLGLDHRLRNRDAS